MFYVLVSGKRDFTDYEKFREIMDKSLDGIKDEIVIVEGGARGTDYLARQYAIEKNYALKEIHALWDTHGKAAGPIRNSEMVKYLSSKADCKAAFFWDGKSRGTGDCYRKATKAGITCEVYEA